MAVERVILIGLSGTGKSAVAPLVARRLGFEVVDTDEEIVRRVGCSIPEIFARFGEPVFRAVEREIVREACARSRVVLATGGGVVLDEANWDAMRPQSVIVHLTADPTLILERLGRQAAGDPASARPLLQAEDPRGRLEALWRARRTLYERADATVDAGLGGLDAVAEAILAAVAERVEAGLVPVDSIPTPTGRSDIYVAHGLLAWVGDLIHRRWPEAGRAWVISDDRVWEHWGEAALDAIGAAGLAASWRAVPAGEASKSLGTVGDLLDWLIGERIDRRDVVVALGGGVVGDLAGFVASIVLRGVGLVQVPTSLLAMVDSSVGGKTGVNHPLGKNLIGTFYQPPIVAVDPSLLETLPERELRAGWAEIVKHAMIERTATGSPAAALLDRLEALPGDPLRLGPGDLAWIVERNIQLKAAVVRRDEREAGPRRLLNYGHTLGHAMEAAGYRYLHGEAVALGMRAAARIALRLGRCERDLVERQDALLDRLGLPARFDGDLSTVVERLSRDKKAVHGTLTWILPVGRGEVEIVRDVPLDVAVAVARDLGAR